MIFDNATLLLFMYFLVSVDTRLPCEAEAADVVHLSLSSHQSFGVRLKEGRQVAGGSSTGQYESY